VTKKVVIGLDSSTQSTKAIAWNPEGEAIAEGRAAIPMDNPRLDCFEQNPADWWRSCTTALKGCVAALAKQDIDASAIQGLAISNQRETLGFVDANDNASYPAIVWLDERSRNEVKSFSETFGAEEIHRITGRPVDITPCLYRYEWLRTHEPQAWANTACFVDVQAYLVKQLCGGEYRTGSISADPMGIVDMATAKWSKPLLDALELDESRLPVIHPPGSHLGSVTESVAGETGLPVGLPVFAAGGDGQCAGLGTNCTRSDRAYINLGTAVVSGIWSPDYHYNRAWRTELAAQGQGYILENCLRSGAFLIDWFVDQFVARGKADASVFKQLEESASELPIGSDGLLVQPYFSGVMDPHWDISARGVILGLSGSHNEAHIYRALIEAITLDQVMCTEDMETAVGQPVTHYVAIGGGASSALWRQMLADASGKPVHISTTLEASALGAGMIAAYGAGWYNSITDASEAMAGEHTITVEPDQSRSDSYRELLPIYRKLYGAVAELNHDMVAFAGRQRNTAA
jgi:xylulokinase